MAESSIRTKYGHRLGREVDERLKDILTQYEAALYDPNTVFDGGETERNERIASITEYKSEINPLKGYNGVRKDTKLHKAKQITYETMNFLIDALRWTPKFFIELFIPENAGADVSTLWRGQPDNWVELQWPTDIMKKMADILDSVSPESVELIEKYIDRLLPVAYSSFVNKLMVPFEEDDDIVDDEAAEGDEVSEEDSIDDIENCIGSDCEGLVKLRIDNATDRFIESISFIYGENKAVKNVITNDDLIMPRNYVHAKYHFWVFKISDIQKVADKYCLSPHWLFYGNSKRCILAKRADTERLLNKFQFLSPERKEILYRAVEKSHAEGMFN